MLAQIGVSHFDELLTGIPEKFRYPQSLNFPGLSEFELWQKAEMTAQQNKPASSYKCFLGAGAYLHYIPSVVDSLASRAEFLTAYTPYQPEISQGTLRVIYEFQSLISELTGLDYTNASLYDGSTAAAEAALMAIHLIKRQTIAVHHQIHPETLKVIESYLSGKNISLTVFTELSELKLDQIAGVIFQSPSFQGEVLNLSQMSEKIHAAGSLLIQIYQPISLGLYKTPAENGADIAVAEGQSLGIPLQGGGPYLGLFSCKSELLRMMPGRLVGKTKDIDGKTAYVLTLQTREQHIRREKATSNICTNQGLMALRAVLFMSSIGKQGILDLAKHCLQRSRYLKQKLKEIPGVKMISRSETFHEFIYETPVPAAQVLANLKQKKILGGLDLARYGQPNQILVCCTEVLSQTDIDEYIAVLQKKEVKEKIYVA